LISAANCVEAGTVLAGRASDAFEGLADLDDFIRAAGIRIMPVDELQARLALEARVRLGRGFGARAGLNFGDSFAYALAKSRSAPLLFVGDDFKATDITPAL
jgi:ribonuclease VapC